MHHMSAGFQLNSVSTLTGKHRIIKYLLLTIFPAMVPHRASRVNEETLLSYHWRGKMLRVLGQAELISDIQPVRIYSTYMPCCMLKI